MGGPRVNVDKEKFIATLNDLENKNTYRNWHEMQTAVANSEYGRSIGISPANCYSYIIKFGITPKTERGKKGGGLERLHSSEKVKMTTAEKWKDNPLAQKSIKEVRAEIEGFCGKTRYKNLLDKFEAGSRKAKDTLICLGCCAGNASEVRNCELLNCPNWLWRPWKAENNDDELLDVEIDDVPIVNEDKLNKEG